MNDMENNEHDMDWLADQLMRLFAADDERLDAPEGMCRESRRAWRLLLFLREVISEDADVIPRDLDRYLNLEWPMVDFDRTLDAAMRNALGVDDECCGRHLSDYTQEEYEDACRNLFTPIVLERLPHPMEFASPYLDVFLSWELFLSERLHQCISPQGDVAHTAWGIVCDYMRTGAFQPDAVCSSFLKNWNRFLLTRQWPERETALRDENTRQTMKIEEQMHILANQNCLLAEQGKELEEQTRRLEETNREKAEAQRLYSELQERMDGLYVSLPLAANVLLASPDGQLPGKQEKNTFVQRLGRKLKADGVQSMDSRTGVRFYRLDTLHRYCSADRRIRILPDNILARLINVAILKQDIEGYRPRPDV